MDLARNLSVTF